MPTIFDVLYREFCRARLAEMRKQLLLWPGTPVVPQPTFESGRPDDAADITSRSSQESDSPAESPFRGVCRPTECLRRVNPRPVGLAAGDDDDRHFQIHVLAAKVRRIRNHKR
jgi:hypothetical protein